MTFLLAGLFVLSAAAVPRFVRCDGGCQVRGDTLVAALAVGDTARLEWDGSLGAPPPAAPGIRGGPGWLRISPAAAGRGCFRLCSRWSVRWDAVPRRRLLVPVRSLGAAPRGAIWDLGQVQKEVARLLRPCGLFVRLRGADPVRLSTAWDLDGNGMLDLWRNEDPHHPSPEEDALLRALARQGVAFPQVVLFRDPVRVGWAVEGSPRKGDTVLQLRSSATLPWRDKSGGIVQYVLEGAKGERADAFTVTAYPPGAVRVQAKGPRGGLRHDHPGSDLVMRPETGHPAFGFTGPERSSPSLLFLEPEGLGDPYRCARVLARELGHALGLQDTPWPENLMSAILHLDTETPTLTPDQVIAISKRLEGVAEIEPGDFGADGGIDPVK